MLKTVSMLMIIILHICLKGGVLYSTDIGSVKYTAAWFIESVCYCGVNCYALITGYLLYRPADRKFRYSGIIPLWLKVFIYSAGIGVLFKFLNPGCFEQGIYSFARFFIPVTGNIYWYFTSYFGMFFFIPFFNALIDALDRKRFIQLIVSGFLIFSFIPFVFTEHNDIFGTLYGYSTLWLIVLYFAGAFIKRFGDGLKIKKRIWAAVFVFSSVIPCVQSVILDIASISAFEDIYPINLGGGTYNYTSPFTVAAAVSLFMLFKDTDPKGKAVRSAASFLSEASFSVYLIHVHPLIFDLVLEKRFSFLAEYGTAVMLLGIILCAAAVFTALSAIDYIRVLLFRFMRVTENSDRLFNAVSGKIKSLRIR